MTKQDTTNDKSKRTQLQMYWEAHRQVSDVTNHFMDLVRAGDITGDELKRLIKSHPEVWSRFASWINKLPSVLNENIDWESV